MNADDRIRLGLPKDGRARITTAVGDGIERTLTGMQVIDYDLPPGTCAAYFLECNALFPLWQDHEESKT